MEEGVTFQTQRNPPPGLIHLPISLLLVEKILLSEKGDYISTERSFAGAVPQRSVLCPISLRSASTAFRRVLFADDTEAYNADRNAFRQYESFNASSIRWVTTGSLGLITGKWTLTRPRKLQRCSLNAERYPKDV